MNVAVALSPENIIVNSKSKNKDEVIKELAHVLYIHGDVSDENQFLTDVYEREKEGPTGIGNMVAIPHGKGASVIKPSVAIATLSQQVPWESLDGLSVNIIILFAVTDNSEGSKTHLRLLSQFAKKLGNDEVLTKLAKAHNAEEIISAFK